MVNSTLILMPASPALIPALAPQDQEGKRLFYQLKGLIAEETVSENETIDLVGSRSKQWFTKHTGSFRAWGIPEVEVTGGNYLPELVQRFVLGSGNSRVRSVRGEIASTSVSDVILVALDGSTGLSPRAPSALLPSAESVESWCRALLSGQLVQPLSATELIDAGIREPALWLELVRLQPAIVEAELVGSDISHGVGRYVARWKLDLDRDVN